MFFKKTNKEIIDWLVVMQTLLSTQLALKIIVGFGVGALIGLERQKWKSEQPLGLRSFGLISLFGMVAAYLSSTYGSELYIYYATGIVIVLVTIYSIYKVFHFKEWGLTTPLVFALAYLLGILVGLDDGSNLQITIAASISLFTTFILSIKEEVGKFVKELTATEITSALELALLAILVYPIIPEGVSDPFFNVINLRLLYYLMLLLLSIMFLNYIAIKKFAYKGVFLFGFFGGLINSEATVSSLAKFYTPEKNVRQYVRLGILNAHNAMIIRNLILVAILDPTPDKVLTVYVAIPVILFILVNCVRIFFKRNIFKNLEKKEFELTIDTPFSLKTAVEFTFVFTAVTFASVYLQVTFTSFGLYAAAIVGGIANAGAVTLAIASLFSLSLVSVEYAGVGILLANIAAIFNKIIFLKLANADKQAIRNIVIDATILILITMVYVLCTSNSAFF